MSEKVKKYITYPLVVDWLQWSDEFKEELGKPDMPQMTLTLISEMRTDLKKLAEENKVLVEALEKVDNYPFNAHTSYLTDVTQMKRYCRDALARRKEMGK